MYNTRRTGAASAGSGRAASATQVNYHQQPGRGPPTNTPQSRNPGYSTQQTPYNSAAQPAYQTQPAYTTPTPQQKPAPPPQPPAAAAQPPLPAPAKQPATPTPAASLKQEPLTPADTPKMDTTENGTGAATKQPFWKKRPFVKVSNKVRKARQNAKLRRILNPKNALTFLNELKPGAVKFNVREEPGWGYVASVDIDGKTFSGNALSMSKAKVQASEQALKHLLLEQLSKSQAAAPPTEKEENKESSTTKPEDDEAMQTDSEDGGEPKTKKAKVEYPEDELPWGSLAAFALHKLFAEWQSGSDMGQAPMDKYDEDMGEEAYFTRRPGPPPPEFGYPRRFGPGPAPYGRGRGFTPYPPRGPPPPGFGMRRPPPVAASFLPGSRPALPLGGPNAATILPMKKIPEDANKRHPVMLLNQLKPNVMYNETKEGESPNVFFNISIEIDGKQYFGRGKSKKEAKKNAAKAALVPLGIQYDE